MPLLGVLLGTMLGASLGVDGAVARGQLRGQSTRTSTVLHGQYHDGDSRAPRGRLEITTFTAQNSPAIQPRLARRRQVFGADAEAPVFLELCAVRLLSLERVAEAVGFLWQAGACSRNQQDDTARTDCDL